MKVFGVVGWKNSGKTGLMERLIAEITSRGVTVSTVKHAHHSFDVDQPGKDSERHRSAGATEVLLSSRQRWALMHENRDAAESELDDLLPKLDAVDLVLIEGYKRGHHAKIEAHRHETAKSYLFPDDPQIMALASDTPIPASARVPVFDLDDTTAIADFVLARTGLGQGDPAPAMSEPGKLKNDCFALPPGVDWVPVDDALKKLRTELRPVVETEDIPVGACCGRVLAQAVVAPRSNPPAANSAVDGYGFDADVINAAGPRVSLVTGRAAAGAPYAGSVPPGLAVRILTGALVPQGVDTVVLQEDVTLEDGQLLIAGKARRGANIRNAGEDVAAGDVIFTTGRMLRAPDVALLSAVGCDAVTVFRRLRVGVLSTGDEIVTPGAHAPADQTYDANRPMLLSALAQFGYDAVDLGHIGDDRGALRNALDDGAKRVDVVITSGGASAGDEDHLASLLTDHGEISNWRIAMKPGRPLALGFWQGVPLFGLPGNPVAALVCALVFARPAMAILAGGDWLTPQSFRVPAAFQKNKKPGRREYLRARLTASGEAEVFSSEGSGRISGLSWADGLVELPDDAQDIQAGDLVKYTPFASYGI